MWENEYPYLILGVPPWSPPVNAARFAAEFLHPDDLPIFEQVIARTLQAHEPLDFACRIRRPDGETRWVEFTGKTEPAEDGRAQRIIGTMQDITARKQAEEALRSERERLALALQSGTMGVYDLDLLTSRLWWSPEIYAVFGVNPLTFQPTLESFNAMVHPDDREALWRKLEESQARREPFVEDSRYEFAWS